MPLRDYQNKAVENVLEAFKTSNSVLLQMPTGTGKTEVFSQLIKDTLRNQPGRRIIVFVHRIELVNQIKDRLNRFQVSSGVIQANNEVDFNFQVHVCSRDTLMRRNYEILKQPSLLVIDEAHHSVAETYRQLIETYQCENTKILGVTATPVRLDGVSLQHVFKCLIVSEPISWFIQNNHLSKIKYFAIDRLSRETLRISNSTNDFEEEDAFRMMNSDRVLAEICSAYQRYANDKKTLIFCVNQQHSLNLKERFENIGIESYIIQSDTPPEERKNTVQKFLEGSIKILINVNIFTEGFDCPDVEAVILARPTKSLTLFLQMIGRVTRTAPGKIAGLILDNADNFKEHGHPTTFINWHEKFEILEDTDGWQPLVNSIINNDAAKKPRVPLESRAFTMVEIFDPQFDVSSETDSIIKIDSAKFDKNILSEVPNVKIVDACRFYQLLKQADGSYKLNIDFTYQSYILNIANPNEKNKSIRRYCYLIATELSLLNIQTGNCEMDIYCNKLKIQRDSCSRYSSFTFSRNFDDIANLIFLFVWCNVQK